MSKTILKRLGMNASPNIAREALRDDVDASTINNGLILRLAEQAHEANRVLCIANGDTSQSAWTDASKEVRASAIKGVLRILQDDSMTPEASHVSWMDNKIANGWKLGEAKDEAAKTHPCLVPYTELPQHEQLKDNLFVVIVEAGLGIAVKENEERSRYGEPETESMSEEVENIAAECFTLMRSIETLEAVAGVLETAPAEEINETNAALLGVVVNGVVGKDEGERMMPSAESFSLGSKRVLAAYAREGIVDKIKDGAKKIIEKIIELIQKFWEWLTLNQKSIKFKLLCFKNSKTGFGKAELKMQSSWHRLTTNGTITEKGTNSIATQLSVLCGQASDFVGYGFATGDKNDIFMAKPGAMGTIMGHSFKGHEYDKSTGTITLYAGINNRNLTIVHNKDYLTDPGSLTSSAFEVKLQRSDNVIEYAELFTLDVDGYHSVCDSALELLAASEAGFSEIKKLQGVMKKLISNGAINEDNQQQSQAAILKSYNRAFLAFIDGIYTEAVRHGNAVVSLCAAYSKVAKREQNT